MRCSAARCVYRHCLRNSTLVFADTKHQSQQFLQNNKENIYGIGRERERRNKRVRQGFHICTILSTKLLPKLYPKLLITKMCHL
jgi:hypothetical protein